MSIKSNVTDKRPRWEKFRQTVKLVSGGFACPEAFPNGGDITILPWDSTIDTWMAEQANTATNPTDRDRILFELMAKLCVLGPCKLEEFVLGDVNTVLMVARSIARKNVIEYTTTCPECSLKEVDRITVPRDLREVGRKEPGYQGFDEITLSESQDKAAVRPLRIRDTLAIMRRSPEAKKELSNQLAHLIAPVVAVNSTTPDHRNEIIEWYFSLHPADAKQLEEFEDEMTPHLSQDLIQQCPGCKHVYMFRLGLDFNFFRTGRVGSPIREMEKDL
jgi:hypothetical protein